MSHTLQTQCCELQVHAAVVEACLIRVILSFNSKQEIEGNLVNCMLKG